MAELDRRDFLKLTGAGAGTALAAGCSDHVEQLIPYVVQPEEITPGNPVYYASTCTECSVGCGIHVKTREGRPIKIEGNPDHPVNRGRLCARGQAAAERSYSPDRIRGPMLKNSAGGFDPVTWEQALQRVAEALRGAPEKAHLLGGRVGPTADRVIDRFVAAAALGGRTFYEPFAAKALREAAMQVHGIDGMPQFDLEGADLVVDFGSELLDTGHSPVEHARQWADARDIERRPSFVSRLVYIGARLSLTASASDEWLSARPGSEAALALALAKTAAAAGAPGAAALRGQLAGVDVQAASEASDIPVADIERLGRALARSAKAVALPPGSAASSRRAVSAAAAVLVLNQVLGGRGVQLVPEADAESSYQDVLALVQAMKDGNVKVLLVHDANPLYSLPQSSGFDEALKAVELLVSFSSSMDETAERADVILPAHAPLESWGDRAPRPGVRALVQPTLRPLYDTRQVPDALLALGRALSPAAASRLPAEDFRAILRQAWNDTDWHAALRAGGVYDGAAAKPAQLATDVSKVEVKSPELTGEGDLMLLAFPHGLLGDGSGAALSLLQEIPDPVTSVSWDSWAEISKTTAARLGVEMGDVLHVKTSAGEAFVAAYVRGGIRDDVIAIPTGQGHRQGHFASKAGQGLAGTPRGVNVFDLLPGDGVDESGGRAFLTERAQVDATGRHRRLPMSQFNDNKRGRQLGEQLTLQELAALPEGAAHGAAAAAAHGGHGGDHGADAVHGAGAAHGGHGSGSHEIREPFDPADDATDAQYAATFNEPGEAVAFDSPYRWGMSVDIDKCNGCSACIAACYVENNIPRVGEDETRLVRQMAWLRIDRWVGAGEAEPGLGRSFYLENREQPGVTDIRNSPMFCQHCGAAPCEPVCPVIATYHNEEGLNAMIYNRCIGTRYCANNCPYKVRRFNYFDHQLTKWPEPMELGLNPDVTVRGQGVMEKCTMCVQRIQHARQQAAARGEEIADGAVQTACQQTCPTDAIHFGNLRDKNSQLRARTDSKRGYHALHVLNTRPAVTYLAKVERGKVEG